VGYQIVSAGGIGEVNRFDIKTKDDSLSGTKLCLSIRDMNLFFYTKDEYRDSVISNIIN